MLYISCLQPTGVSPALNNRRRASSSSSSYVSQQKTLLKKKKKEEESAACQFTFLLDKPGCMDARMDEDEPCDVNLECPLEPFDISKCLKRHKGVLKMGVNHAVRFTLNAENLFVSPLPGSTIFLDDEVVTDKDDEDARRRVSLAFREIRVRFDLRRFLPVAFLGRSRFFQIKKKSALFVLLFAQ